MPAPRTRATARRARSSPSARSASTGRRRARRRPRSRATRPPCGRPWRRRPSGRGRRSRRSPARRRVPGRRAPPGTSRSSRSVRFMPPERRRPDRTAKLPEWAHRNSRAEKTDPSPPRARFRAQWPPRSPSRPAHCRRRCSACAPTSSCWRSSAPGGRTRSASSTTATRRGCSPTCATCCAAPPEAEDVVQDVFLRAYGALRIGEREIAVRAVALPRRPQPLHRLRPPRARAAAAARRAAPRRHRPGRRGRAPRGPAAARRRPPQPARSSSARR